MLMIALPVVGLLSAPQPTIQLRGLLSGEHCLNVAAVDEVGNMDPHARLVRWTTHAKAQGEPLTFEATPGGSSTTGEFRLGGWSKDLFRWRVDAGPWTTSRGSPSFNVTVLPARPHFLEVLPGEEGEGLQWLPASHMWSVMEVSPAVAPNPLLLLLFLMLFMPSCCRLALATVVDLAVMSSPKASTSCSWPCSSPAATLLITPLACRSCMHHRIENVKTLISPPLPNTTNTTQGSNVLVLNGLAEGAHKLTVKAVDAAGNLDPGNTSAAWVVDTLPPTACTGRLQAAGCAGCAGDCCVRVRAECVLRHHTGWLPVAPVKVCSKKYTSFPFGFLGSCGGGGGGGVCGAYVSNFAEKPHRSIPKPILTS